MERSAIKAGGFWLRIRAYDLALHCKKPSPRASVEAVLRSPVSDLGTSRVCLPL